MPKSQSNKPHLKDITDSIERGIRELFESGKYQAYLATMSRLAESTWKNSIV